MEGNTNAAANRKRKAPDEPLADSHVHSRQKQAQASKAHDAPSTPSADSPAVTDVAAPDGEEQCHNGGLPDPCVQTALRKLEEVREWDAKERHCHAHLIEMRAELDNAREELGRAELALLARENAAEAANWALRDTTPRTQDSPRAPGRAASEVRKADEEARWALGVAHRASIRDLKAIRVHGWALRAWKEARAAGGMARREAATLAEDALTKATMTGHGREGHCEHKQGNVDLRGNLATYKKENDRLRAKAAESEQEMAAKDEEIAALKAWKAKFRQLCEQE